MSTQKDYAAFVDSRFKEMETPEATLIHAAIGVAGEAGEIIDAVKKHWVYNQPLNEENLYEEMGDIIFYLQKICNIQGWTFKDLMISNTEKLLKRYPTGYSDEAARVRADKVAELAHDITDGTLL